MTKTKYKLKGEKSLNHTLKELRILAEQNEDPVLARIAYSMELAITWATQRTIGWTPPEEDAKIMTDILYNEIKMDKPE